MALGGRVTFTSSRPHQRFFLATEPSRYSEGVLPPSPALLSLPGGATGVLLLHGFTGSPSELSRMGRYLHRRGYTVAAPLLPGHGTTPADLNRTTWRQWLAAADEARSQLEARCPEVMLAGLSMGALLALQLAHRRPPPAVVLYSPALYPRDWRIALTALAKYFIASHPKGPSDMVDEAALATVWSYSVTPLRATHQLWMLMRATRRLLGDITTPTLIFEGARDRTLHPHSARALLQGLGSRHKSLVTLRRSGHVLTADQEWEHAAELTARFLERHQAGLGTELGGSQLAHRSVGPD